MQFLGALILGQSTFIRFNTFFLNVTAIILFEASKQPLNRPYVVCYKVRARTLVCYKVRAQYIVCYKLRACTKTDLNNYIFILPTNLT